MNEPSLLLHISTDRVLIFVDQESITVPYKDLERTLPPVLIELIEKHGVHDVVVVNGPGSFTQLRIGSVSLNLIIALYPDIQLRDISKEAIYGALIQADILPTQGVMMMGQRKKMRYSQYQDDKQRDHRFVTLETVGEAVGSNPYWIDDVSEHVVLERLDLQYMCYWKGWDQGVLRVEYDGVVSAISLQDILEQVETVEPRYMIEPTIG